MKKLSHCLRMLLISIPIVLAAACRHQITEPMPTVEKVRRDIESNLSVGAPRIAVEKFLERMGIDHSFVEKGNPLSGEHGQRLEYALISATRVGDLGKRQIQVIFRFDPQDRLLDFTVEEVLTGP